ncbi:MAG TPA: FAD-dependent oxidoreductase, partial [Chitinophagaceae bacterium]|nr:FAD-dependent oxidoreductase [Chitinophagaceae bacterium]
KLVYHALRERGLLFKNAPHLVKIQDFIIPCYSLYSKYKYLAGLKLYDLLSKGLSFGKSMFIKRNPLLQQIPGLNPEKLQGGVKYFDGQFDDARLAINLAQTCAEEGGTVLNHIQVTALLKKAGKVSGVSARDMESGTEYSINAKVVINATGVFVDDILKMDLHGVPPMVSPSQGVHLVLNKSFLNSRSALMIPETADGRVLFAIPWHDHLLVGTTDTPIEKQTLEPRPLSQEVAFILETVGQYLTPRPKESDVLSMFAGLRPLAAPGTRTTVTKEISRDHKLIVSDSGLVTITGGKWTTYRKMAEETVDRAIGVAALTHVPSATANKKIHGWTVTTNTSHLAIYGSDAEAIEDLITQDNSLVKKLVADFPHTEAEVLWAVRYEMARTIEDVLARRLRILFLDAKAALDAAPMVAEIIAEELGYDDEWKNQQLADFSRLANQYLLKPGQAKQVLHRQNF